MRRALFVFFTIGFLTWLLLPRASMEVIYAPPESTAEPTAQETEGVDPFIQQATQTVLDAAGLTTYTPPPTRTPDDYRIVFLFAEGAIAPGSLYAPDSLAQYLPIEVAHRWEDVLALDAEAPIEALIVHESAKEMVDYEWTAAAALDGVTMATINLYFADYDRLMGRRCKDRSHVKPPFNAQDYWVAGYFFAQFTDPAEKQAWYEAEYINCTKYEVKGGSSESSRGSQSPLARVEDVRLLGQIIKDNINAVDEAKESFRLRLLAIERGQP